MKKLILGVASLAAIAITAVIFYACNKEQLENGDIGSLTKSNAMSSEEKEEIDKLSLEIAQFHDYVIQNFMADVYQPKDVYDEKYHNKVCDFTKLMAKKYPFEYMKGDDFEKVEISYNDLLSAQKDVFKFIEDINPKVDAKLIQKKCQLLEEYFYKYFIDANSLEELENNFASAVKFELESISNRDTYMSIRFFADTYIGSFKTWCSYYYSDPRSKEQSFWGKVKAVAKDVWKVAKPIMYADAKGALYGAMVCAAGGTAMGPGAATGAIIYSMEEVI